VCLIPGKPFLAYLESSMPTVAGEGSKMPVHLYVPRSGPVWAPRQKNSHNWIQSRNASSVRLEQDTEAERAPLSPWSSETRQTGSRGESGLSPLVPALSASQCLPPSVPSSPHCARHRPFEFKLRSLAVRFSLQTCSGEPGAAVPGRRRHRSPHRSFPTFGYNSA